MSDLSADPPNPRSDRLAIAFLLALVLVVFGRLCVAEFSQWDDPQTIAKNPAFDLPIGESLHFAWTTMSKGLYVPVTLSVWTLLASVARTTQPDAVGSTLNPWVFHTFNVACHLISTWLVFLILRRLCRTTSAAWMGAALFAVHPLQVETVAWVSGTKDLLCWAFCFGGTLVYLRAAQGRASETPVRSLWHRSSSMPIVLLLLILALLSKPSAMVLPAALFVIEVFLVRLRSVRRVAFDLLPLAGIALAGALVARTAQNVSHIEAAPIWARPLIMGDALCHYLTKLVWPAALGLDYGRSPTFVLAQSSTSVRWVIPAAVAAVVFAARRRSPVLVASALIALLGLAPVLGLSTFQMQGYSTVTDHYAYFSMFGIGLIAARAIDASRNRSRAIVPLAAVCVATLSVRCFSQAGVWHDSITLFTHAMQVHPRSLPMANNLATYYLQTQPPQPLLAKPLVDLAIEIAPDEPITLTNWITCQAMLGRLDDSNIEIKKLRRLLDDPRYEQADRVTRFSRMADTLIGVNRLDEARDWASRALEFDPKSSTAQQAVAAVNRASAATRPTSDPAH